MYLLRYYVLKCVSKLILSLSLLYCCCTLSNFSIEFFDWNTHKIVTLFYIALLYKLEKLILPLNSLSFLFTQHDDTQYLNIILPESSFVDNNKMVLSPFFVVVEFLLCLPNHSLIPGVLLELNKEAIWLT